MNSLLIRLNPNCSDISLAARDLVLSLHASKRIAFAAEYTVGEDWWTRWPEYGSEDDPVTEAINRFVDDSAVCLHVDRAAAIELDQKRSNHAVIINAEDCDDPHSLANLKLMDAIWCTSTSIKNKLERAGLRSKILVTGLPVALHHPSNLKLSEGGDLLCVDSWANVTGLIGLATAWMRSDLADGKTLTLATTGVAVPHCNTYIQDRLIGIRRKEGNLSRRIQFANLPSPATLDLMVEHTGGLVSCHLDRPSWRPIVLKAALLGKPTIFCERGELRNQIDGGHMFDVDSDIDAHSYDQEKQIENVARMADILEEPLRRILAGEVSPIGSRHQRADGSLLANQKITGAK